MYNESDNIHMGPSFLLIGVICINHCLLIVYKIKSSSAKHEMQTDSRFGNLKMNTERLKKKKKRKYGRIFYVFFFQGSPDALVPPVSSCRDTINISET